MSKETQIQEVRETTITFPNGSSATLAELRADLTTAFSKHHERDFCFTATTVDGLLTALESAMLKLRRAEEILNAEPCFVTGDTELDQLLVETANLQRGPAHNNMDTALLWQSCVKTIKDRLQAGAGFPAKEQAQNFQSLRDSWALKSPLPSKEDLDMQAMFDRQANPHNEPYHNKRPRRTDREIHSDLAYRFADVVLYTQYGQPYEDWLQGAGYAKRWDFWRKVGSRQSVF